MKAYIAGALFNEAEIAQRKKEVWLLRERFPQLEIISPIDQPFNTNRNTFPTPQEIFMADTQAIRTCDVFLADITNDDAGVMLASGIAIESHTPVIIGINSDTRLATANQYDVPTYGFNHYVLGAFLQHGYFVRSFAEAMDVLAQEIKNIGR